MYIEVLRNEKKIYTFDVNNILKRNHHGSIL